MSALNRNSELLDQRLARTSYFVLPKLAIKYMPKDWQDRFESLMVEAELAGLETPDYNCFRTIYEGDNYKNFMGCKNVGGWDRPFYKLVGRGDDPWANYRHGNVIDLMKSEGV